MPDSNPRRELISFYKVDVLEVTQTQARQKGKGHKIVKEQLLILVEDRHASTYGTKSFSVISNHIADSTIMPVSSSVFVT